MLAFAGNSILCRLALSDPLIDPVSFTFIRLASGALMLSLLVARPFRLNSQGCWLSAISLFLYALLFSYGYRFLGAAEGALILFTSVQLTVFIWARWQGNRFSGRELLGAVLAWAGLCGWLLPATERPSVPGFALMLCAGIAWGVYTMRGKALGSAIHTTAASFQIAALFALALWLLIGLEGQWDWRGVGLAIASGALTSGLGYALWYKVLPFLSAVQAGAVQLSVPVWTAALGVVVISEPVTITFGAAAAVILGGIGLTLVKRDRG